MENIRSIQVETHDHPFIALARKAILLKEGNISGKDLGSLYGHDSIYGLLDLIEIFRGTGEFKKFQTISRADDGEGNQYLERGELDKLFYPENYDLKKIKDELNRSIESFRFEGKYSGYSEDRNKLLDFVYHKTRYSDEVKLDIYEFGFRDIDNPILAALAIEKEGLWEMANIWKEFEVPEAVAETMDPDDWERHKFEAMKHIHLQFFKINKHEIKRQLEVVNYIQGQFCILIPEGEYVGRLEHKSSRIGALPLKNRKYVILREIMSEPIHIAELIKKVNAAPKKEKAGEIRENKGMQVAVSQINETLNQQFFDTKNPTDKQKQWLIFDSKTQMYSSNL